MDIDPSEIGQRTRLIRRRRGLSLDVAAGLAGISKSYLSRLESGQRRFERRGLLEDLAVNSRVRPGCYHLNLARALTQDDGPRDAEALRQLDTADRAAPVFVRNNPVARELFTTLHRRAKRAVWELDSLRNRFGVG